MLLIDSLLEESDVKFAENYADGYDPFQSLKKEKIEELQNFINAFLDKHVNIPYFEKGDLVG